MLVLLVTSLHKRSALQRGLALVHLIVCRLEKCAQTILVCGVCHTAGRAEATQVRRTASTFKIVL